MARVVVPIEAFRTGMFPPMCALTGARADPTVPVQARLSPGVVAEHAAALAGQQWLAGGVVPGKLPYAPEVLARRQTARRVTKVAFGAMVAAGLLAIVWWPGVPLAGALLLTALGGDVVARRNSVRAEVVAEGRSVRLTGVCAAFAEAVRAQGLGVDR